ncbi:peptidoglycan-binding domain-containing protein [Allorhizobium taibaishanense]|uniref:Peptidoglycan hydrolase-like protein with peptidoglycan-binding domain n=1 Tax=Allorhizobium taibaishanense TaxID=887144 RepID=A0A1Q8ZZW2_9HYPH|nr:peptidoglycan-binding domain-containing protein [Allorhizobium taibaishanense]MBB4007277.1 peptidoglycan hydrolase-like protein with peptidoglycan-binding domain [Allorhizobium taibaishanense]OLP47729.1 hypothetical protein BJF91_04965 [Allorhizobium taibaishanense]
MTTRQRKTPSKSRKPVRKEPGLFGVFVRVLFRGFARHPVRTTVTSGFVVALGFVAANAFWYQPGRHPSPFLRTRDPHNFTAMLGMNTHLPLTPHPDDVTTFRIERQSAESVAAASATAAQPQAAGPGQGQGQAQPQPMQTAAIAGTGLDAAQSAGLAAGLPANAAPDASLTAAVQSQLSRLGFYDGAADGRRGPKTDAAIAAYQRRIGLPVTGAPSDDLLAALSIDQVSKSAAAPVRTAAAQSAIGKPRERPAQVNSEDEAIDPVAAAIRSAEKSVVTARSAPAAAQAKPIPAQPVAAQSIAAQSVSTRTNAAQNAPATLPVSTASAVPASIPASDIAPSASAQASLIMDIQRGLINIAYTDISVDGVAGDKTKAAIRHFERHYRLPETGEPNMAVLKKLKSIGAL